VAAKEQPQAEKKVAATAPVPASKPKPEKVSSASSPAPKSQADGATSLSLSALLSSEDNAAGKGGAAQEPTAAPADTAKSSAAPDSTEILAQRSSRIAVE